MNKYNRKSAFTIVELIIVIAIIGILITISVPLYSRYVKYAEELQIRATAKNISVAMLAFDSNTLHGETTMNPSAEQVGPYLSSNIKIVSGLGKPNTNAKWGHYTAQLKPGEACIHILRKGSLYTEPGYGKLNPPKGTVYVVEMLNSEGKLTYYNFPTYDKPNIK